MSNVLNKRELTYLKEKLGRQPTELEHDIVGAEWSEHCSYKSSKKYIRLFPTESKRILIGPGYDAGVLDVGGGFVITIHIESHNHPSAIEPYGGAATGVGGVVRDIISMGTRPIAILDSLRFAPIHNRSSDTIGKSAFQSRWLFKNVVRGISDYGNCIGIPTVGGELEFDPSFKDYCLVDVACIGFGRKDLLIKNTASVNDLIILVGGATGRDGIHGASFASKKLEMENRSAVQIPDPFLEKLLLEATIEAVEEGCVKSIKDLGGGGLSCCLSEISENIGKGIDVELTSIHSREDGMSPAEMMISESQERMLFITDLSRINKLRRILDKYEISYSLLGTVKEKKDLVVRYNGNVVAQMPSQLVANAPLADRLSRRPRYIDRLRKVPIPSMPRNMDDVLLAMLSNPTISDKGWVYGQYDNEVGVRTVLKPGSSDACVLRLDNGKFISAKLDGNSKHCFLDPYLGTMGCLSEGCRNTICTGAEPIGIVDHLQFGNPEDPEVFWSFRQSVDAIIDYCEYMQIPVVGGKVSFYNETLNGSIKPSPVIGALGLIDNLSWITGSALKGENSIFLLGYTSDEMGGSEYYEYYHDLTGGVVPRVELKMDKRNSYAVQKLIRTGLVDCVHDCSKGGLAIALSEMAVQGMVGVHVDLASVRNACSRLDNLLFSESQSRYLIGTKKPWETRKVLAAIHGICFAEIGKTNKEDIMVVKGANTILDLPVSAAAKAFNKTVEKIMQ